MRFLLQKKLGKGVHEALDTSNGTLVALKRLSSAEPAELLRFKREFRSLADVTHENLVPLYELFVDEEGLSFSMELVRGAPFIDALRPTDPWLPRSRKLNVVKVRDALRQLAQGVAALHDAGMLHRDLKHSNVLVGDRVVILDFGLVGEEGTAGTPPYMSPEQFQGRATPASDWYAVGIMLYEVLTGGAVYRGPLAEVILEKTQGALLPVRKVADDVPHDLAELCDALVQRDPARRPKQAEILAALGGVKGGGGVATAAAKATATAAAATTAARATAPAAASTSLEAKSESAFEDTAVELIGREAELAALRSAFGRGLALVHGPSGIGKSALVKRFVDEIDGLVLFGRCYERETVPFKALDGVIDALARRLRSRGPVQGVDVASLARLFPVLGSSTGGLDPVEERRRAFAELRALFAKLNPVVVIDDMQWGDVDSALLLEELLRAPCSCFVVGVFRSEERGSPFLRRLLSRIEPVVEVQVKELSFDDAKRVAGRSLTDESEIAAVASESGGHPFFIDELVRFVKSGAPLRDGVRPDVRSAILSRCERLTAEARHLLEVTALASRPIERRAAADAARIVGDDAAALASLRASHLLRVSSEGLLETYHDRIRETVVASLSPDERRFLHGHLARACTDPEALAHHHHGAGDDVRAAECAVEAAERAMGNLAFHHAARLYEMALAWRGADLELQVRRAKAHVNAGQCPEAARAFLDAAALAEPRHARDLKRQAAEMLLLSGRTDEGIGLFREILAPFGMALSRASARTLSSILLAQARLRLRGIGFRERPESEIDEDELFLIDVCRSVSTGLATGGADALVAVDFQERCLLRALSAGEPRRVAHALAREAMSIATGAGIAGRARVDGVLATVTTLTERLHDPYLSAHLQLCSGIASFFFDRFREAAQKIDVAERMLRDTCTGVWPEISQAHFYKLGAMFALDEWKNLDEGAARVFLEGEENGDAYTVANCELNLSRSWLMRDDPKRARALVDDVSARWSRAGFHVVHWLVLYHGSYARLYDDGDVDAAHKSVRESWRLLSRALLLRLRVVRVYGNQLRASTALARGGRGDVDEAERCARRLDGEPLPWATSRAALIHAAVRKQRGDVDGAVLQLRRAIALADDAGLPMHKALARVRLGGVLGGDAGKALVDEGHRFMRGEGVVSPDKITRMLAPGFD